MVDVSLEQLLAALKDRYEEQQKEIRSLRDALDSVSGVARRARSVAAGTLAAIKLDPPRDGVYLTRINSREVWRWEKTLEGQEVEHKWGDEK